MKTFDFLKANIQLRRDYIPEDTVMISIELYVSSDLYIGIDLFFPVLDELKCKDIFDVSANCNLKDKKISKKVYKKIKSYFNEYLKDAIDFDLLYDEYNNDDDDDVYVNLRKAVDMVMKQVGGDWNDLEKGIENYVLGNRDIVKKLFKEYIKGLREHYQSVCQDKVLKKEISKGIYKLGFNE